MNKGRIFAVRGAAARVAICASISFCISDIHWCNDRLTSLSRGRSFDGQPDAKVDGGLECLVDGAAIGEDPENAVDGCLVGRVCLEPQVDTNPLDDENTVFLLDVAFGGGEQPFAGCRNLTRLQRASKGSGESTRGGSDDVVEGGGVGREEIGGHFVVLGNRSMHSEEDGIGFGGEPCPAHGALYALDCDFAGVGNIRHPLFIPQSLGGVQL